MTCARLLISAWLVTWVATGPLFDTHLSDFPDITDGPASLQGAPPGHFHLSNYISNFEDVNVALLEDEDKSKKRKGGQPGVVGIFRYLSIKPFFSHFVIESHALQPMFLLFVASQGPRAPPFIVSL